MPHAPAASGDRPDPLASIATSGAATRGTVLVTGATGYVGGRLVPRLIERGWRVRCLVRSPDKLARRAWADHPAVEVIEGDLADEDALAGKLEGCHAAYYLIHSMVAAGDDFADRDLELARRFAAGAARADVRRIVYLGGLGELGDGLSEHLRSRHEVEDALRTSGVPVTALRAAVIIGSGSASFEMLRYAVERLPVMVVPRWVRTESQPIAIRNVLLYLVDCLDVPETEGRTLDIGGPDVLQYRDLMRLMAEERGLSRRLIVALPFMTPHLSSYWLSLVTPVNQAIARPLVEGLRNRVVCRNDVAAQLMPQELLDCRMSIRYALGKIEDRAVETSWSAAGEIPGDPDWAGGTCFVDRRATDVDASPRAVFAAISRLGGGHGWYGVDWLWRIRGMLDVLVGGPGLRRGRRDPHELHYGEALDFWRVVGIERDRSLSLLAEMRLPGEAMLEFAIEPQEGGSRLVMEARFRPKGLFGLLYWWSVLPFHEPVFAGMLRGMRGEAERQDKAASDGDAAAD